ncbi:hypothetical protein Tco_0977105 [Tanacetum coccineum]|uniref:Uncharacterized protein n=1 Tax=Tanacetum coccineum TaxID=301880 RepID=A0ABQ5EJL7_9ASTR
MFKESDFNDIDNLVDEGMAFVQETVDVATTRVSTVSLPINTAGVTISVVDPRTPPKTITVFDDDEDLTIAQTLMESDAELSQRLHEEELAALERAQQEKQKQEEATIATLVAEFDVDYELAIRLRHEEQGKYSIKERARLLKEYFDRRKKQLAAERAEAIRNKPPTKNQLRNKMITYLKHI